MSRTIFFPKFLAVVIPSSSLTTSPFCLPNAIFQYVEPGGRSSLDRGRRKEWSELISIITGILEKG